MKILELFGGIGACSKAFKRLGIDIEIADYVEIDKYAVKSYNAINGTNFEPQDITKWDKDIEADFIMHGSPCQDFSLAGNGLGGDEGSGTRSSLMYETIRIVEKLKPKYVLWENVKNLLSKKHIHNFKNYISIMNELGYNSYYQVLNSKNYGIPQNRERVFTLSIRQDIDNGTFVFPKPIKLEKKLKDLLEDKVDEKYYLSDKMKHTLLADSGNWKISEKKYEINRDIARTNNTRQGCTRPDTSEYICDDLPNNYNILKTKNTIKQELCDYLIHNNMVKENDVVRHNYSSSRLNEWEKRNVEFNNISPTLDTRSDCLGIVVKNNTKKGYLLAQERRWNQHIFSYAPPKR